MVQLDGCPNAVDYVVTGLEFQVNERRFGIIAPYHLLKTSWDVIVFSIYIFTIETSMLALDTQVSIRSGLTSKVRGKRVKI